MCLHEVETRRYALKKPRRRNKGQNGSQRFVYQNAILGNAIYMRGGGGLPPSTERRGAVS